jgi:exopolysaccharide biosynthesis predicted pyruvyltransferase EpsI
VTHLQRPESEPPLLQRLTATVSDCEREGASRNGRASSLAATNTEFAGLQDYLNCKIEAAINPLLVSRPAHICLIDPPVHANVGDSAILIGELDYLARNCPKSHISFCDMSSSSAGVEKYIAAADVLLIHGGGNFGDIWPGRHDVRMKALARFADKRVIQMPQSIHFADEAKLWQTSRLIARHRDFTLLVRDQKSYDFATSKFDCPVFLVPDMAFAMKPIAAPTPALDCFCLLRTDKEAVADHRAIAGVVRKAGLSFQIGDWIDDTMTLAARVDRKIGKMVLKWPQVLSRMPLGAMAFRRRYAEQRLAFGIDLLTQGAFVVTDRLHAHIISCLLGIPQVVFDSFDGKISALHATWTFRNADVHFCTGLNQLGQILNDGSLLRGR